ncbi:pantoate--beta-alanine ligase [Thiomicrorhabdus sp. ZW0627]|uniref:pantoate--beta-alanine ligase n=1 Tax=Thiomicrorhabdus sp. ZW0627 TaxID=3039774 RepID=UPI0024372E68|nr:pantoate--beta-alanine ligase [Thiomicrorhabdus sp. ZW0627]MDG6773405.1 pantoate--beta-alanine ligase [Thiomicrorhabdus sp. ZW0627]
MQIIKQVEMLRTQVREWKSKGLKVGFVPTMGNLHAGHLSLMKLAREYCDKVVVSIFVNPLQFGPNEDFDSYPRTFEADQQKMQTVGVDVVFYPTVDEMYPCGQEQTLVKVPEKLTGLLEGASRPGHFDGVTTVVSKLFNMVQPDVAVFGQKDYQQYCVIEQMVRDMAMPIDLIRGSIARDEDGLALSSRNQYLTPEQREIAPKLYVTLMDVLTALESGNRDFKALESAATQSLLGLGFDAVDYVKIVHPKTLLDASQQDSIFVILAVARLGQTRLLDNVVLG